MKEYVIKQLILEDLKFHQFKNRLEALDITLEYHPDFAGAVARLLEIPFSSITDEWIDTYAGFMKMGEGCGYFDEEGLKEVAEKCWGVLKEI